jgi:hypothetical protein
MAKRLDSLAHIRTMFFTMGVAHLSGDGGVIELLKQKGFTVEPVFSSKKFHQINILMKLFNLVG